MALKDPKILIGAGVLAAWLLSSSAKASTSSKGNGTGSASGNNGNGSNTPSEEGEAAGPAGCKPGLIIKDGICVKPPNGQNNQGNQDQGGITASSLTISSKCDSFTFGDKTGNAWWTKNEKTAQQWVTNGYNNPLQIAYGMIKKNKEVCFKDFPDFDDQTVEQGELEFQLLNWIKKYPKIWELIWWLRNKIDNKFFLGRQTVTIDPKTYIYTYGKNYDFDILWDESLMSLAGVLLAIELENPGALFKDYNMFVGYEQNTDANVATYLYHILFPNIDINTLISRYKKGQINDLFYDKLWDYVSSMQSELEDYNFDPGDYGNA